MEAILLRIKAPEQAWCSRLNTAMPDVKLKVHSCFPRSGGRCVEMVEMFGPGKDTAIAVMEGLPRAGAQEVPQARVGTRSDRTCSGNRSLPPDSSPSYRPTGRWTFI